MACCDQHGEDAGEVYENLCCCCCWNKLGQEDDIKGSLLRPSIFLYYNTKILVFQRHSIQESEAQFFQTAIFASSHGRSHEEARESTEEQNPITSLIELCELLLRSRKIIALYGTLMSTSGASCNLLRPCSGDFEISKRNMRTTSRHLLLQFTDDCTNEKDFSALLTWAIVSTASLEVLECCQS